MRIAVCVKQVLSRDWPIRLNDGRSWVREEQAGWELNEPDAFALEEAFRVRERHGGEVMAVSAGPARVTHVLREALARGADRAIHVAGDHLASADAFTTAQALSAGLAHEPVDLILAGLQSEDQGFAQVGVILAELIGMAHSTIVVAIDIGDRELRVKRELEGGLFQWVTLPLPAVLTIQSGINQLRYATLRGIMAARKKEIRTVEAPPADPMLRIVSLSLPDRARRTRLLSGTPAAASAELVRVLREDARVI